MEKDLQRRLGGLFARLEDNRALQAVRRGMLLGMPVLIIGSLALVALSLPLAGYQAWLARLAGGQAVAILEFIHHATLDHLSLVLLLTISYNYGKLAQSRQQGMVPVAALCAYLAFTASQDESLLDIFKVSWLFTALAVSLMASALFVYLHGRFLARRKHRSGSADVEFTYSMAAVGPFLLVVLAFALLRLAMEAWVGQTNFQNLLTLLLARLFEDLGRNLGSGLLFIFLLHFLWFFGIHGGNVLDFVAQDLFAGGMAVNLACVAAGQAPTEIYTKTFFDTMVLMGGCGSLLCLVIAIFIGCRRRNLRALARVAAVPALFNINEILMFGLPIVLNPIMFIPFVAAPMLLTLVSAGAMALHWVPLACQEVTWTTPIFLSGYVATGSIAGSLLQLVNLALGVAVYLPFVRLAQRYHTQHFTKRVAQLAQVVRAGEDMGEEASLQDRGDELGSVAKTLAADLRYALKNQELQLHYQPQVDAAGRVVGAEGLLRWYHEEAGQIYPPLVIALAREEGLLEELGHWVIRQACADMEEINRVLPGRPAISVNVSAHQLANPRFYEEVARDLKRYHVPKGQLGLEITEQAALAGTKAVFERLYDLRASGVQLIMDDFGMGHSSLLYLQDNQFDYVKLDGSLVRELPDNGRACDIIDSIVDLGGRMHFAVVAEYVETQAQRDRLLELGCTLYQGYLYSPALPLKEWLAYRPERLDKEERA